MTTGSKLISSVFVLIFCVQEIIAQNTTNDVTHAFSISQNLYAPTRLATDSEDNIYTIDVFNGNIIKYDKLGNLIETFSPGGKPISIAIDSKNQIYYGDKVDGTIYKLSENGIKTALFGESLLPTDLLFSPDDLLYICDGQLKKVWVIDQAGTVVQTISNAQILSPSSLAYDVSNNRLLVAEAGIIGGGSYFGTTPCHVWVFDSEGTLLGSFGSGSSSSFFGSGVASIQDAKFNRIQGMSFGKCGNLYISDPFQGSISVFDRDFNFLTRFGDYGENSGQMNVPLDIAFDSQERIIITSMNNGAIEVFDVADEVPSSNISNANQTICSGSTATIPIEFTGVAPWVFSYTVDGNNPTEISTNESPYLLEVSEIGLYEVTALADATTMGTCFTGAALINTPSEIATALIQNGNAVLCEGETTDIEIQFTGSGPWTFTYTIDEMNPTTIITAEPIYSLHAEESGLYEITELYAGNCPGESVGNAHIQINEAPMAHFKDQNDQIRIFSGETYQFEIDFTGTAPYTFLYTNDFSNPVTVTTSDNPYLLEVSEGGNYHIEHISDAFCENSNMNDYPEIILLNPLELATCTDQNGLGIFDLKAIESNLFLNPQNVQWFKDENFNELILDPNAYQTETTEVYALNKIYDSFHKEYAIVPLIVHVGQEIDIIASSHEICKGEEVTLEGNGGINYQWDNGVVDGVAFTPTGTTIYSVTTTNENGCVNTASIEIVVHQLPVVDLGPDINICEGETVLLDAGVYTGYLWSNGSTASTMEVNTTGNYTLIVTNQNGCIKEASVHVTVHSEPIVDFFYDVNKTEVLFYSNALNANGHYWEFGDGKSSTDENPVHTYENSGSYTVSYKAISEFCEDDVQQKSIKVVSSNDKDVVDIYPNPSSGEFTIKISPPTAIATEIGIEIKSATGEIIYSEVFIPEYIGAYNQNIYKKINIGQFSTGVYFIYINAFNFSQTEKLILKD